MNMMSDPLRYLSIAPSIGHFGGTAADYLDVPINDKVFSLRLSLSTDEKTYLNLRGIQLMQDGKPLNPELLDFKSTQSSFRSSDLSRDPDKLLRLQTIHSDKEVSPWWSIEFSTPVNIDSLRVYNRVDGWGSRSRSLLVEVKSEASKEWHCLKKCGGKVDLLTFLTLIKTLLPQFPLESDFESSESFRAEVIDRIVTLLKSEILQLDTGQWNCLISILETGRGHDISPNEMYLLASYLMYQRKLVPKTSTGIRSFSLILNSRSKLQKLQGFFDGISERLALKPQFIARHGVRDQGMLRSQAKDNLEHMNRMILFLQSLDYVSFLGYGTLLGAVRESSFLMHDDDVDIIWQAKSTDFDSLHIEISALISKLIASGYLVQRIPNFQNIHVKSPRTGAVVDLFPSWGTQAGSFLHMEKMKIRSIAPDILSPPSLVEIDGHLFPAPNLPAEFLRERYGDKWAHPDPFYEWRWPLIS